MVVMTDTVIISSDCVEELFYALEPLDYVRQQLMIASASFLSNPRSSITVLDESTQRIAMYNGIQIVDELALNRPTGNQP